MLAFTKRPSRFAGRVRSAVLQYAYAMSAIMTQNVKKRDYIVLGIIADKRFHLLRSILPFRDLSVTFMHCDQTAEDIDMISCASDKCLSQTGSAPP